MPLVRTPIASLPSGRVIDGRPLLDRADRKNGHLRLVDDRRADEGPEAARIGDREGSALDVLGHQPLGAGALGQVLHCARDAQQRQLVGVPHDRNDQSPVERDGDADVDVAAVDRVVARHGGIDHRVLAEVVGDRLHDERQEGQVDAALGVTLA